MYVFLPWRPKKYGEPNVSILDAPLLAGLVQVREVGQFIHVGRGKGNVNLEHITTHATNHTPYRLFSIVLLLLSIQLITRI